MEVAFPAGLSFRTTRGGCAWHRDRRQSDAGIRSQEYGRSGAHAAGLEKFLRMYRSVESLEVESDAGRNLPHPVECQCSSSRGRPCAIGDPDGLDAHPSVTIPIRLVAGEPKTPILLTMDRSLTLRGSETEARSKNFVVKTLEREGAAPWITNVTVDRQELTAKIVDTSETRMSEHPGVVMRDYVLQARRTDAADAPQSVVCRISFHS